MSTSGADAEALAARRLEERGLVIVERNWRCRFGEIDIIARDGSTLVFVEVRARSGDGFGGAAASIDHRKQQRLCAAARYYLAREGTDRPCRFDAFLVGPGATLRWIRDAFQEA